MLCTPEWITIVRPFGLPVEPIAGLRKINRLLSQKIFMTISNFLDSDDQCIVIVGKPSWLALRILQYHSDTMSIFDVMDDYPEFYDGRSRKFMKFISNQIASYVSHILISSEALSRNFVHHESKLLLVRNACDTDALPYNYARKHSSGPPILGYVGTIGHWFDWSLLSALAEADQSVYIRLVGPMYARPTKSIPSNVEVLPACDHATAVNIMKDFSAGLILFKSNQLTRSVDPIKYYEYRALGLSIISSRFGGMETREGESGVFFLDKHTDPVSCVRMALSYQYEEDEVRNFRNRNSWMARFDERLRILAIFDSRFREDLTAGDAGLDCQKLKEK